jgi:hypothetical protein
VLFLRPGAKTAPRRQDGTDRREAREDDVTEFGSAAEVPDADRGEQAPAVPGDIVAGDVPEADAIEQRLPVEPEEAGAAPTIGDREADPADVLEQEAEVPVDDEAAATE